MDIIAHTASTKPNKEELKKLFNNDNYNKIELDIRFTRDYIPVWSHSFFNSFKLINYSKYKEQKFITLEDILELADGKKDLIIEFKNFYLTNYKHIQNLDKTIESMKYFKNNIGIQSFNQKLIKHLLENRSQEKFSNIELGLIINIFKLHTYFDKDIKLNELDFISLSNILWEFPILSKFNKLYKQKLPNTKQYAWSWDAIYLENEKTIKKYIDNNADGIITSNPKLVKQLYTNKKR